MFATFFLNKEILLTHGSTQNRILNEVSVQNSSLDTQTSLLISEHNNNRQRDAGCFHLTFRSMFSGLMSRWKKPFWCM